MERGACGRNPGEQCDRWLRHVLENALPHSIYALHADARRTLPSAPTPTCMLASFWAREPSDADLSLAMEFLHSPEDSNLTPWDQYAQVLLASNEALYVD